MPPQQNPRGPGSSESSDEPRLESWGEIATYLRREVRTVQRWEKSLGLPVRRLQVGKQSSVYAFRSELDKWYRDREPGLQDDVEPPDAADVSERRAMGRIIALAAVGLFSLGALAYVLWIKPYHIFNSAVEARPPAKIRLFVRPFAPLDPNDSSFAEGLTDEINTQLGRLDPDDLGVIAPTSAKIYAKSPIPELVVSLKIDYTLEGSVRRAGGQVRIDTQLISAADQTPVWSESYTDTIADILTVQDRVAADVAGKILERFPRKTFRPAPVTPVNIEGYDAYLAARRAWAIRDLPGSVSAFKKATELLPSYSPAHSGLAAAYAVLGEAPNDGLRPAESAPLARSEALEAQKLDPGNAESHCVLGNIALSYDWDFRAAEREFRAAIALEPGNATAHQWLGQYFMVMNRIPDAQSETNRALDLDPASPIYITARAEAFYYAHDFDSTLSHAQIAVKQFPQFVLGEFWLGSAYREKKMYQESLLHFTRASKLAPENPALLMAVGHVLAVSGDRTGAQKVLEHLTAMARKRYVPATYFAGIYTGLGDLNNAFLWLQKAVEQRNDRLIYLEVDPISDPLRADPRFASLMREVGNQK
jgi:TolB-like protein/Flp pilus assembly protein TadD